MGSIGTHTPARRIQEKAPQTLNAVTIVLLAVALSLQETSCLPNTSPTSFIFPSAIDNERLVNLYMIEDSLEGDSKPVFIDCSTAFWAETDCLPASAGTTNLGFEMLSN